MNRRRILLGLMFITMFIQIPISDPYLIFGHIVDKDGKPIPDVFVTVVEMQTKQVKQTITDENGRYKIILDDYKIGDTIVIIASDGKRTGDNKTIIRDAATQINVTLIRVPLSGFTLQYILLALAVGSLFLIKKLRTK